MRKLTPGSGVWPARPAEAPAIPGDIIPEWWAASFRNHGRLAPESAQWDNWLGDVRSLPNPIQVLLLTDAPPALFCYPAIPKGLEIPALGKSHGVAG